MQLVYSTRVPVRLLKSFMLNHSGREQPRGARTPPVVKTLECYNDHITPFIVSVISQTTANFSDTGTYKYKYTDGRAFALHFSGVTFLL